MPRSLSIGNVLLISHASEAELSELTAGVSSAASFRSFRLRVVGNVSSREAVKTLLDLWTPLGCIVHCGAGNLDVTPDDFGSVPVVWLDRDPSDLPPGSFCVAQDSRTAGILAARELLCHDLASYAFIDNSFPLFWSHERRDCFKDVILLHRRPYFGFEESTERAWREKIPGFLSSLPKPAGVFCANDKVAAMVIEQADALGIPMPGELAIVGVDDVPAICESTRPTLSSVHPSFASAGRLASDLLRRIVTARRGGGGLPDGAVLRFAARDVTLRQSTRVLRKNHSNIDAALEYIRKNAADGVCVDDVVKVMGVSRRLSEIYFKRFTGNTITDEIHEERVKLAQRLIFDGIVPLTTLHTKCGFKSPASFRRVFKAVAGCSPRTWKKRF